MSFQDLSDAVLGEVKTAFASLVEYKDAIQMGDLDRMLNVVFEGNSTIGIMLAFVGGVREANAQFAGKRWRWSWVGAVMILYKGEDALIEDQLAQTLDILRTLMVGNHTLGGAVFAGHVVSISTPEKVAVGDGVAYWVPFNIEVTDKIQ